MRGMTWAGYFYNMVHSEPSIDAASRSGEPRGQNPSYRTRTGGGGSASAVGDVSLHLKEGLMERSGAPPLSVKRSAQDDALDAVSRNLAELHNISLVMGQSLESQNEKLDELAAKTDKVNDATLEVLLKSSQLIDRNSNVQPIFIGEFCFELHTGGYLSVLDEMLVIGAPIADLSSTFRCFSKGDNLFGLISARTMKFVAAGYFTPVTVSATQFNRAAQMFVDLSGEFNGILILSCNWGSGGWLKFSPGSSDFKLTSSLRDKDNRVLLRAIPLIKKDKRSS